MGRQSCRVQSEAKSTTRMRSALECCLVPLQPGSALCGSCYVGAGVDGGQHRLSAVCLGAVDLPRPPQQFLAHILHVSVEGGARWIR